jgi:cell division septal protein FtsQ
MATRKTTTKRKTPAKRRRTTANRKANSGTLVNFAVPLVFIVCILFCLGFLTFMGYRTVTASAFFDVKSVDVNGANRSPKDAIENIIKRESAKTGVWNADLAEIKREVENLTLVKTATVSRVLPNGVQVNITERVPCVVVQLDSDLYWADEEGVLLGKVLKDEETPPFVLQGWSKSKLENAQRENKLRARMYLQMLEEWQDFEVAKRVSVVDLSDLQDAKAIVRDSGENVSVSLGSENFGKRLREALKEIAGKGNAIGLVISNGQKILAIPRDS